MLHSIGVWVLYNLNLGIILLFAIIRLCLESVRKDQIVNMATLTSHFLSRVDIVM